MRSFTFFLSSFENHKNVHICIIMMKLFLDKFIQIESNIVEKMRRATIYKQPKYYV